MKGVFQLLGVIYPIVTPIHGTQRARKELVEFTGASTGRSQNRN